MSFPANKILSVFKIEAKEGSSFTDVKTYMLQQMEKYGVTE